MSNRERELSTFYQELILILHVNYTGTFREMVPSGLMMFNAIQLVLFLLIVHTADLGATIVGTVRMLPSLAH